MLVRRHMSHPMAMTNLRRATIRVSVLALMLVALPACASDDVAGSNGVLSSGDDQAMASSQAPATTTGSTASVPVSGTPAVNKGGSQQPSAIPLKGTKWQLRGASLSSINLAKYKITIEFTSKKVAGFAGVNRYTGSYERKTDGSIKFGPLATTKMAGPPDAMAAEAAYLKALQSASHYSANKSELTLVDPVGVTLEYKARK